MKTHEIRVATAVKALPGPDQLAWKLAELAADPVPVELQVAEAVVDRLIDATGVAIAALGRSPVVAARAQALAHSRADGATIIGLSPATTVDCEWAAWANGTAIRELDFHDNFYGANVCHPADGIAPILAVAQQCGMDGGALTRAIAAAYEVHLALSRSIALTRHGVDHTAHLAPAVVVGLGALLSLDTAIVFEAINHAVHVSFSTVQGRHGRITGWKANAPGHVGKLAIEAVDRAMRGEQGPTPVYEGAHGAFACLLEGPDALYRVALPERGEPWRSILESYTKAHATGYHAQAFVDLAFRMRDRIADLDAIDAVEIRTKAYTHFYVGSGANDPEKMNPEATRETLDHSVMFAFAAALLDGEWDHERTFLPERVQRPELVRLWHKVRTVEDDEWTHRFRDRSPLQKDHGGHVVIRMADGRKIEDEIDVPNGHPRGRHPFSRADYLEKFGRLAATMADKAERRRFIDTASRLSDLTPAEVRSLTVVADPSRLCPDPTTTQGIFDRYA